MYFRVILPIRNDQTISRVAGQLTPNCKFVSTSQSRPLWCVPSCCATIQQRSATLLYSRESRYGSTLHCSAHGGRATLSEFCSWIRQRNSCLPCTAHLTQSRNHSCGDRDLACRARIRRSSQDAQALGSRARLGNRDFSRYCTCREAALIDLPLVYPTVA